MKSGVALRLVGALMLLCGLPLVVFPAVLFVVHAYDHTVNRGGMGLPMAVGYDDWRLVGWQVWLVSCLLLGTGLALSICGRQLLAGQEREGDGR